MLGSGVGNYLPVVNASFKTLIPKEVSENVLIFLDVDLPHVWADFNPLLHLYLSIHICKEFFTVPTEMRNHYTYNLSLITDIHVINLA